MLPNCHPGIILLSVYILFATIALAASSCVPSPVAITIGNVTLSNNHVTRGLELSIGTPAQSFAFMPQWPMNNSLVYGVDGHCPSDFSSSECTTFRGGSYNAIASTSRAVPQVEAYPIDTAPWSSSSFVADNLFLGLNGSESSSPASPAPKDLTAFPLGVPLNDFGQQGYHPMNVLGLGYNSTLLNTLKTTGKIASRTWSMFWGLNGVDTTDQMDGVFVLGGYDAAKVIPTQKFTLPLADAGTVCSSRMVVSITDMILNFSNGTNASIFPGAASTALQACITPDYPVLMTVPNSPYFENIEYLTNQSISDRSFGLVYFANRYAPNAIVYTGDLTIKFQTGLSVRIPNNQIVVPDRYIDSNGVIQANSTGYDTTILSMQNVNANDMMQLGRQFLSSAYVMLNQDANEFTLWQANPTTNRDLIAVDETNAEVSSFCSASNTTTPQSAESNTANGTNGNASPHKSVSTGVIVGATAIGCVISAAVVGVAVFCCYRRQKRGVGAASGSVQRKFDPGRNVGARAEMSFYEVDNKRHVGLSQTQEGDDSTRIELMDLKETVQKPLSYYELQG